MSLVFSPSFYFIIFKNAPDSYLRKGVTQFGESVTQFIKAIESAITEMNETLANLICNYSMRMAGWEQLCQVILERSKAGFISMKVLHVRQDSMVRSSTDKSIFGVEVMMVKSFIYKLK